jgi:hypothetical protein
MQLASERLLTDVPVTAQSGHVEDDAQLQIWGTSSVTNGISTEMIQDRPRTARPMRKFQTTSAAQRALWPSRSKLGLISTNSKLQT